MRIVTSLCNVAVVLGVALAAAVPGVGQMSSAPAGVVVFPHIIVDGSRDLDTIVQLSNTSDTPAEVRCLYSDETPECIGTGACSPNRGECDGACVSRHIATTFRMRLTPHQPIGWSAARGLRELPLSGVGASGAANSGGVPAIAVTPFEGVLHCVVVDDAGIPAARNALVGTASIESAAGGVADAAQYDGIGLEARAGVSDGDRFLRLGGPDAEYAGCPARVTVPHFFDGATVTAGTYVGTTETTLALVPCGGDLLGEGAPQALVQITVRNEFVQRFSTSRPFEGQIAMPLSLFDTTDSTRSIFAAGVTGTLTGVSEFDGIGGGILGVAIEAQRSENNPSREHRAALALGSEGTYGDPAVLALLRPACSGDCNGDGEVRIEELLLSINVALGSSSIEACRAADLDNSATVRINELTSAVQVALSSCPAAQAPTFSPPTATPRPTPNSPLVPGADITFLGIASGDDVPQMPVDTDDAGRPIYTWPVGQGFSLIVEARPNARSFQVGQVTTVPGGETLPDLQVIVSRPLGDGSPTLCDVDPPTLGGVPATDPFEFSADPPVVLAINDLGCRADDGRGVARGRPIESACTRLPPTMEIGPAGNYSRTQFCIPIARAWAFPEGDTLVAARARDTSDFVGPAKEIVIRVLPAP